MARRVVGIICYCVGGSFLYTVSILSFFNVPANLPSIGKLWVIGIFLFLALIFLGIGLILRRLQKWKYDIAVVLLSTSGFSIFIAFTVFCLFFSPEVKKFFPENKLIYFNDYFSGVLCLLIFICVGSLLLVNSKNQETDKRT